MVNVTVSIHMSGPPMVALILACSFHIVDIVMTSCQAFSSVNIFIIQETGSVHLSMCLHLLKVPCDLLQLYEGPCALQ